MADPHDPAEFESTQALPDGAPSDSASDSMVRLEKELREERRVRRRELVAQEHRLVSAVVTFLTVLLRGSNEERRDLLPSAAGAVAWCLIPSGGTAAVGLVALASLLATWQQARLLALQNEKIEIQNILAEAQRRAALMFETTAIFAQIDQEKSEVVKRGSEEQRCASADSELCWRPGEGESSPTFVPSRGTIGRLAALSQALRPYRYLSVEGASTDPCPQDTLSPTLDAAYQGLLQTLGPSGKPTQSVDEVRAIVSPLYTREFASGIVDWMGRATKTLADLVPPVAGLGLLSPRITDTTLNCSPSSPERGQLLVSLHAAGVDLSAVQRGGGDFTYADIPGAFLKGVNLERVSLNAARLPRARFDKAHLVGVSFRGADLSSASFSGASLEKVDFEGARLQVFGTPTARKRQTTPLHLLPKKAKDNLVSGLRVFEESAEPRVLQHLCYTLSLPSGFLLPSFRAKIATDSLADLEVQDLSDHGILIETVRRPGSPAARQFGLLMFSLGLTRETLVNVSHGDGDRTTLEYIPIEDCAGVVAADS